MRMTGKTIYVSAIVPIYRASAYLRRCLDSCIYQTMAEIEVIIVNDCSPDLRDDEIALEYKEQYPDKVVYIKNDKNLGSGGARNKGILAARGEYFICIDADDYVDLNICRFMYQRAAQEKADMVICGYHFLKNGKVESYGANETHISVMAATKLFRRKLFVENKLFFPEQLLCEDYITIVWHFASTKTVCVDAPLYYYVYRDDSRNNRDSSALLNDVVSVFANILKMEYFAVTCSKSVKSDILRHLLTFTIDLLLKRSSNDMDLEHEIERIKEAMNRYGCFDYLEDGGYLEKRNLEILRTEKSRTKTAIDEITINLTLEEFSAYRQNRIILWGCGRQGRRLAQRLHMADIRFECVDSNPKLSGDYLYGNRINTPSCIALYETDTILLSVKGRFEEIKKQIGVGCVILDKSD